MSNNFGSIGEFHSYLVQYISGKIVSYITKTRSVLGLYSTKVAWLTSLSEAVYVQVPNENPKAIKLNIEPNLIAVNAQYVCQLVKFKHL